MLYSDKYAEITGIVRGSTWKKFFDWLYKGAQVRYSTKFHLNNLSGQYGTAKKLAALTRNGFLTAIRNGDVYVITKKTKNILKAEGYNTDILQSDFNGLSVNHELKITDVLIPIMKEPHFYAVFFYKFGYVNPDAIVIYRKDNAYKIVMLEVETPKDNWQEYLDNKQYPRLATDIEIYEKWWKVWSEKLRLPYCTLEQFCFSVRFVREDGRDIN